MNVLLITHKKCTITIVIYLICLNVRNYYNKIYYKHFAKV